jgi:hypothetical protein
MFPDQKSKRNNWLTYIIVILIILALFFWIKSFFGTDKSVRNSSSSGAEEQNYDQVSSLTNLPAEEDDSFNVGSQSGATYPGNSLAVTNLASTSTSTPVLPDGAVSCNEFVYNDWTPCLNGVQTRSIKSSSPAGCVGGSPVYAQNCGLSIVNTNICNSFTYSSWGSCSSGVQYRSVTGSLPANCSGGSPVTSQSCNSNNNNNNTSKTCTSFSYSTWGTCSGGVQTRSIVSSSPSSCSGGNPVLSQSCSGTANSCTSFTYSTWSSCANGNQTRSVQSSSPTGCSGGTPVVSQSCVAATTTLSFFKKIEAFTVTADKIIDLEKNVNVSNLSFKWGDDMASCGGTVKISENSSSWKVALNEANVITPSQQSLNNIGKGRYIMFSKTETDCSSYYVNEATITGKYDAPLTSATTTGN